MGDRELIDTGNDKRYVRRAEQGRFTESDRRSVARDQRQPAETETKKSQGDRGNRKQG